MKSTPELLNEYDRLREHGVAVHEERRDSNGKRSRLLEFSMNYLSSYRLHFLQAFRP